jgi:hypothetical protein
VYKDGGVWLANFQMLEGRNWNISMKGSTQHTWKWVNIALFYLLALAISGISEADQIMFTFVAHAMNLYYGMLLRQEGA